VSANPLSIAAGTHRPDCSSVTESSAPQALGRRIAEQRSLLGLTQSELAERVGISRVALSHIEGSRSIPGERTVALLAGCFRCEPHELVVGTDYPRSKAERLPAVAARYTEVEHRIAVVDAQLALLDQIALTVPADAVRHARAKVVHDAKAYLDELARAAVDPRERAELRAALARLNACG
jgi:transcriptional regulator with XRE-family HTH domain